MTRILSETRSFRSALETYLTSVGWSNPVPVFTEGWQEIDITNPLVNIYLIDRGKQELELGRTLTTHKLFDRIVQVDVFMESEDRVRAVCEDVMEFMDSSSLPIYDLATNQLIGYMSCPDTSSIRAVFAPPDANDPQILRWRGIARGNFEAYYPNGGDPI